MTREIEHFHTFSIDSDQIVYKVMLIHNKVGFRKISYVNRYIHVLKDDCENNRNKEEWLSNYTELRSNVNNLTFFCIGDEWKEARDVTKRNDFPITPKLRQMSTI